MSKVAIRLSDAAGANPTAENVIETLRNRKRHRQLTDLRQFQRKMVTDGMEANNKDYYAFFRELDKLGIGSLILRKGKPPRFKWGWSLRDVIQAVDKPYANDTQPSSPVKGNVVAFKRKTKSVPATLADSDPSSPVYLKVCFRRDTGDNVEIPLPTGLTRHEAQELGDIIKSLG